MKSRAPLWTLVGVIAALILLPVGAYAATQLVSIAGGGNKAWVDGSHRLLASEADSGNLVNAGVTAAPGCQTVYNAPAGKQLVVRTMDFVAQFPTSANSGIKVYTSGDCSGTPVAASFLFFGPNCCTPTDHVDFGAGLSVAPGGVLSVKVTNQAAEVYMHGYLAAVSP